MTRKKLKEGQEHTLKPGDHVRIGNGKVDWEVEYVEPGYADSEIQLRSPMSGRQRVVPIYDLVLVKQGGA